MPDQLQRVPRTALSAPATFLVQDKPADNETYWPIRLQARSKEVLDHWYWGRMVHDFEGLEHNDRIKIDYCHDAREILGYCDQFEVSAYGLELAGQVVSASPGDRSAEIAHKARNGVPYEASIEFSHRGLQIEFIPEGRSIEVNGLDLDGPLHVFRKWKLTGVAVCPNGYDDNTRTEMSDGDKFFELSIQGENQMPKPGNETNQPNAGQDGKTTELTSGQDGQNKPKTGATELGQGGGNSGGQDAGQGNAKPGDNATGLEAAQKETRTQLGQFCERFGKERGAEYFLQGLTYSDAVDQHSRHLETELQKRDDQITELNGKIEATQTELGESSPVSSSKSSSTDGKKSKATGLAAGIVIK